MKVLFFSFFIIKETYCSKYSKYFIQKNIETINKTDIVMMEGNYSKNEIQYKIKYINICKNIY